MTHPVHGYSVVNLAKEGKTKQHRVHILVAEAFIPNPKNKPTVNHKFGEKSNNHADFLEWATNQEQMEHASEHGLTASGERNGGNKISDVDMEIAYQRCMSGEAVMDVASSIGVNRNTLTQGFYRLGHKDEWKAEALRRKSVAAIKRWS